MIDKVESKRFLGLFCAVSNKKIGMHVDVVLVTEIYLKAPQWPLYVHLRREFRSDLRNLKLGGEVNAQGIIEKYTWDGLGTWAGVVHPASIVVSGLPNERAIYN